MSFSPSLDIPAFDAMSAHPLLLSRAHPLACSRALLAHLLTSVDSTPVQPLSLTPTFAYGRLFAISHFPASSPADLVSEHTAEAKTSGIEGQRA